MAETKLFKINRLWIWSAFTLPGLYILLRYATDKISYGQVIHATGDWSIGFLIAALAVTPLRRFFPLAFFPKWLMRHRRAMGLASFGYAAFHTITYLERKWGYGYIQQEATRLDLLTGWIALIIFLILALTSNDASVKKLKRNWKRLHRSVYLATGLTFAHWVLTSLDPRMAYICMSVLCLIEALRILIAGISKRGAPAG